MDDHDGINGEWLAFSPDRPPPWSITIRRLLVANRGEIARRIFRTCRQLQIETVAVYSDPDRLAPHVAEADHAVALGGTTSTDTYLAIDKILDAAKRTEADAVHPGYGFLAENAAFAQAVIDAGLVWVGPPPAAIAAMADKLRAKELVGAAGVPLPPAGAVTGDDPESWMSAAKAVGYPLLVKAAAGGGGKGMRRVDDPAELADAVAGARREAQSSFGDPTLFCERLLERSRHVEVQVMGDQAGTVLHAHTRDCSVQRRHQKVIEEAPAPGLAPEVRRQLHQAAIAAAKAVDYVGAGTVEFLVAGTEVAFLEMNTRLQVEHPVTEAVTGEDLVAWQLAIASGARLTGELGASGHALEARLYAEDPAHDYLPSTGRIERFQLEEMPGVRVDSGVETGSEVSPYYDPLLAKVIAAGLDREQARRRLVTALRQLQVHGVTTNRDALVATLEHPAFVDADLHTGLLDENPKLLVTRPPIGVRRFHAVAATLALRARRAAASPVARFARAGWRNVNTEAAHQRFVVGDDTIDVAYGPPPHRGNRMPVWVDGDPLTVVGVDVSPTWVDIEVDGLRRRAQVHAVGDRHWVNGGDWQTALVEVPRFADHDAAGASQGPTAPMPGTVASVEVTVGDRVRAGQTLVVLEAMKVEHRLASEADGTVAEVRVSPGDQVDAHQLLVVVDPDGVEP